jgi:4'-phosphopantetheinyl transferase
MVLYAVTMNRNIGIDVEYIKDNIDVVQIANRFFSSSEIQSLDCIPDKERPGKFFQYWTRKEALAKAIGKGVSFPFEQCDVSLINGKALSPVKPTWPNTESTCWHIQDLFPGEGYAASISTEGGNLEISYLALSLE